MAIRRIVDLPSVQAYSKSNLNELALNDYLMEVSIYDGGKLKSSAINLSQLSGIVLDDEYALGRTIRTFILSGGTNVVGHGNDLSVCFSVSKLSSTGNSSIKSSVITNILGNPAIINGNLSVYGESVSSSKQTAMKNSENIINVKDGGYGDDQTNLIANCNMLSALFSFMR